MRTYAGLTLSEIEPMLDRQIGPLALTKFAQVIRALVARVREADGVNEYDMSNMPRDLVLLEYLIGWMSDHGIAQPLSPTPAELLDAIVFAERQRCARIVAAAQQGHIPNPLRTILNEIAKAGEDQ